MSKKVHVTHNGKRIAEGEPEAISVWDPNAAGGTGAEVERMVDDPQYLKEQEKCEPGKRCFYKGVAVEIVTKTGTDGHGQWIVMVKNKKGQAILDVNINELELCTPDQWRDDEPGDTSTEKFMNELRDL